MIEQESPFYIVAGTAPPDARTLVLKHGDTFGVFNVYGDIDHRSNFIQGLFAEGMRHLSRLEARIDGERLLLLSSKVTHDNSRIIVDLTNPDLVVNGHIAMPRGSLHLSRTIFLWANTCFERLTLANYELRPVEVTLSIAFESDFADIFELRGTARAQRGTLLDADVGDDRVVLSYAGLDGVARRSVVHCAPQPASLSEHEIQFRVSLPPRGRRQFEFTVRCEPASTAPSPSYKDNAACLLADARDWERCYCRIDSSDSRFNQWIRRSLADIRTLTTLTEEGAYPYAGIPWFSTPFGRDGIITALQMLWVNPDIAKGVLTFLATTQARERDPQRDAEPGKILHERRTNEMANTGEVPFGQYYGSVDATPLFIVLAGAYYEATGDRAIIEQIWPNINAALRWIDEFGDLDGDGFVEYHSKARDGLANQGWKDSHDSVFHENGELAHSPIALCEVQGYVYDARRRAAELATVLGHDQLASELDAQADQLRARFQDAFWCDEIGMYALALDSKKRPCVVRTSNAGHCLFSGIADHERARRIRDELLSRAMYSGWGVRTVGTEEARYNPMSYHNGSIWPHDSALIAAGFARYGFRESELRVLEGWFDAAAFLDLHRLPELCCGFRRRRGKGPTLYPVACSPQAWAAGAAFMMLAAGLGLTIDGVNHQVRIHRPRLPRRVDELRLRQLRVGSATLDLMFHRNRKDIGVLVLRKEGPVDIVVTK